MWVFYFIIRDSQTFDVDEELHAADAAAKESSLIESFPFLM
jgi:hypothetical protein